MLFRSLFPRNNTALLRLESWRRFRRACGRLACTRGLRCLSFLHPLRQTTPLESCASPSATLLNRLASTYASHCPSKLLAESLCAGRRLSGEAHQRVRPDGGETAFRSRSAHRIVSAANLPPIGPSLRGRQAEFQGEHQLERALSCSDSRALRRTC